MFEYIEGQIIEKNPAFVVLDSHGVGYYINISLTSYTKLPDSGTCKLFIHQVIREDAHLLFGFYSRSEREVFRNLISVSGVGANTARMILSSLEPDEIRGAIEEGNVITLKSVKGIGAKSAQRIIVDLKGKIGKEGDASEILKAESNTIREEALNALVTLGFPKRAVEKVVDAVLSDQKDLTVEELVKAALKRI